MKRISDNSVRAWTKVGGVRFPQAISLRCPHCGQLGIFTTSSHLPDPQRGAASASGKCPACQHHVGFWAVNEGGVEAADVFFHPDNNDYYELLRDNSELPEPLGRAFISTVDAFNAGNFPATAVCCRRTLEGIFKYLLPEERRALSLAKAIDQSADHVDFALPIRQLANAIRKGGNLGAHFDMLTEPDERVARAMVELLEYLISYLYILPRRIKGLEREFDGEA